MSFRFWQRSCRARYRRRRYPERIHQRIIYLLASLTAIGVLLLAPTWLLVLIIIILAICLSICANNG